MCSSVAEGPGRAGARREETVDVDQFLLVLVSGLASGAVYGLMGLGLVIIYRATDVVNFALASLATVGLYAALIAVRKRPAAAPERRGRDRRDRVRSACSSVRR